MGKKVRKILLWIVRILIVCLILWLIYDLVISIDRRAVEKPIIYFYPEEDTRINIKLKYDDAVTSSYPKYNDGWNILAKSTGNLIDLNTNKELYALYYESKQIYNFKMENDGFVVSGEDTVLFLEDKLHLLGLNDKESEEFIIYWLPKLEKNKYNYIRFATVEEINKNMPLDFSERPDTLIRVLMTYKGLKRPIKVQEQEIVTPERIGFTVVEWGGTKIN